MKAKIVGKGMFCLTCVASAAQKGPPMLCYAPQENALHGQQHERAVRGADWNQKETENIGKFDNLTVENFLSPE
jgi:hypothetical protein